MPPWPVRTSARSTSPQPADHTDRPSAFPGGALAGAVTAALGLLRGLDRPATAAVLELVSTSAAGVHHLAGIDALSCHELCTLIAQRDGLDPFRLPTGLRADSSLPGALDVHLYSQTNQRHLRTTLRGAQQSLHTVNT
ncbi:hypothetical protein [Streptomyces sp. NPDC047315]|uniref:hypothetical protein n=1 Tax=Streptomyces sp. NPDC047315 TaxID=3155142 RepID=UPI00340AAE56